MNRCYAADKRVLVIGQGSIGKRHAALLAKAGADVAVVSRFLAGAFSTLPAALADRHFDYIVVANETSRHAETLRVLSDFGTDAIILCEKPLAAHFEDIAAIPVRSSVRVAYNLRFHPIIQRLKQAITGQRVLSAAFYVGQYLPSWRDSADYRKDSSALKSAGGGVLRDLSHELDLMQFLVGAPTAFCAIGGSVAALDIETDEVWSVLARIPGAGPVSLHMNYFDRPAKREIRINTMEGTFVADLTGGLFSVNETQEQVTIQRNDSYDAMHEAVLAGNEPSACTYAEGLAVLRMIAAIEEASSKQVWVTS